MNSSSFSSSSKASKASKSSMNGIRDDSSRDRDPFGMKQEKSKNKKTIYFYHKGEPYYEFTNFAPFAMVLDSKVWPTSEHYFQAQKFMDESMKEKIRALRTPREAFQAARTFHYLVRPDWQEIKVGVMKKAVWGKFTQNKDLLKLLLSTKDAHLAEKSDVDSFWGIGKDGKGQNMLGEILMEVRDLIQASNSPSSQKQGRMK